MLRKYKQPQIKDVVAAMFAKENQAEVIFFTPDQIDFTNKVIHGYKYKYGEWVSEISYFPDVVYNDIPLRKDEAIYEQLKNEGIPFTTHRLGKNKLAIQQAMMENPYLVDYMIPTNPYNNKVLKSMLNQYNTVFLKPNKGHKGLGITVFEKVANQMTVTNAVGLHKVLSFEELDGYLTTLEDLSYHHLQPGIESTTPEGTPFVIRSYVGRGESGRWLVYFHYAALSHSKSKIVNVSVGSSISYLTPFLNSVYNKEQASEIKKKLNKASLEIAKQTQTIVTPMIDALGIDFALDENGKLYIIEVNAFPGTRPFEAGVERHAMKYIIHLAKEYQKNKLKL